MSVNLAVALASQGYSVGVVDAAAFRDAVLDERDKVTENRSKAAAVPSAGPRPAGIAERIPLGRLGQPEDVAALVRHLAGPQGRHITGQCLHINGGSYLGH